MYCRYLNVEIYPVLIVLDHIPPVEEVVVVHHSSREIRLKIEYQNIKEGFTRPRGRLEKRAENSN
jgi:hypothetical protein